MNRILIVDDRWEEKEEVISVEIDDGRTYHISTVGHFSSRNMNDDKL